MNAAKQDLSELLQLVDGQVLVAGVRVQPQRFDATPQLLTGQTSILAQVLLLRVIDTAPTRMFPQGVHAAIPRRGVCVPLARLPDILRNDFLEQRLLRLGPI